MRTARTLLQQPISLPKSAQFEFVHFLRAILREITYIPDPFARKYHHDEVIRRFRQYIPKTSLQHAASRDAGYKYIKNEEELAKCYEKCREKLSFFYRAGSGDHKALTRALWLAYGRVGRRKHVLLQPLLFPEVPKNSEEADEALDAPEDRRLKLSKSMQALLMQQGQQPGQNLTNAQKNMRQFLEPVLPETNKWGRPMPLSRVRNKKTAQMAALVTKILPPLPDEEFQRLRDLASGNKQCPRIPKRRKRLKGLSMLPPLQSKHKITPRTMRRIWAKLLPLCSTIKHDPIRDKWTVTWGSSKILPTDVLSFGDRHGSFLRKVGVASKGDTLDARAPSPAA